MVKYHYKVLVTVFEKFFFAEQGYSLPIEYYDSIKGCLSDSYSVIGQVWMLFIIYWSLQY